MKPLFFIFLLSFLSCTAYAQNSKYEMSDEVDIPQAGWNKVLMMRNGNTLLFHFELRKGIVVKVFDKTHKEIASQKHICNILDINALDKAWMLGIYDINGEGVLFFEQMYHNKSTLISLRINADNGKLLEEKAVMQSPSLSDRLGFTILKDKNSDNYCIVCFHGVHFNHYAKNELIECNAKHEQVKHVPININDSAFTDISFLGAEIESNGAVCLCIYLANPDVSSIHNADAYDAGMTYNKNLSIFYLPKDGNNFIEKNIKLTNSIYPAYTISSYNSFDKAINIALLSTKPDYYKNGIFSNKAYIRTTLF